MMLCAETDSVTIHASCFFPPWRLSVRRLHSAAASNKVNGHATTARWRFQFAFPNHGLEYGRESGKSTNQIL